MTEITRRLIRAVADGNLADAKKIVQTIVATNNIQKDASFCEKIQGQLNKPSPQFIELPRNIQGLLVVEDVKNTFKENRYYLSDAEKQLTKDIIKMRNTSQKLNELGIDYLNSIMLHGKAEQEKRPMADTWHISWTFLLHILNAQISLTVI